ncbi:helix-turn-helix domain-containing protein [Dolichospermum sp. ST_sed1]|nr:helix-turn-helix domain-containing protein [Dolichospermum sp. ST_sed1]MDD1426551.1 helix-turn-helix domain-containing protein [Dolichospermum sp. ST_sed9]MDD1433109.1 helix-turn-helix domain-containing protein [Dolichospermum sp. ST_sed6]MDD1442489.1 helix-turn-helix domain-containing protein [Dolichospermum sp. ST_sed3]MDD1448129.1 helix-turn-helix domain-containing protein [Dolichospermum sp. ST_sed8]MDD1455630.1 helix-turn-helix domain-containing protein [Dolichospermum sp. ST_sed7]MDD
MLLSFKTALIPNNRQITAFRKASGVARHAYNWANAQIIDILATRKEGEKLKLPSAIDLHKKLVAEVKSEHAWYYEVNKNVPQKALTDLRFSHWCQLNVKSIARLGMNSQSNS